MQQSASSSLRTTPDESQQVLVVNRTPSPSPNVPATKAVAPSVSESDAIKSMIFKEVKSALSPKKRIKKAAIKTVNRRHSELFKVEGKRVSPQESGRSSFSNKKGIKSKQYKHSKANKQRNKYSQNKSNPKKQGNKSNSKKIGKSIFVDLPSIRATTADATKTLSSPGMGDKVLHHELIGGYPGPPRYSTKGLGKGANAHRWIFCDNEKLERLIQREVERTIGHYMKLVINSTQELYVEHRTNIALMLEKVNHALKEVEDTKVAMTECNKAMNEMISNLLNYKKMDRFIQRDLPSKQALKSLQNGISGSLGSMSTSSNAYSSNIGGHRRSHGHGRGGGGGKQMPLWREGNLRAVADLGLSPKERKMKRKIETMNLYKMYGKKSTQKIAPVLTFVSVMSTNSFGFGIGTAAVPNDLVIFKLSASVPIHAPRIKLWPNKSDTNLHRFKVDCMDIEGTRYLWIASCKLAKDSPTGKINFVIQFDSINNVPGISVKETTDGSSVKVVKALSLPDIKRGHFSRGVSHQPKRKGKRKKSYKKKGKCDNYADHLIQEGVGYF